MIARLVRDEKAQKLLAVVLLVLATVPLQTKIFTSDFGTHLALGREIVQTRSIPDKEFLNYPSLGMPNINGEWGFQAVLYLVFSAGGVYGVSAFLWAIVLCIYFFIHRATVLRGAHPLLAVVAIFAFSGFLRIRIQPRPEIMTYFFIALMIYIQSEYYFGHRKKLIYLVPPMIIVWVNMHPTYLMAFILCGAFFLDAMARAAWNRQFRWETLKGWIFPPLVAGAVGLLLCGLSPNGYDALLVPLHLISRGESGGSGGGSAVLMSISELTPVKETGMFVFYKAAVAFAAVSLLLGAFGHRVYLLDLFLIAITFKGAWDSARAVSMMGLFLSPGASVQLTGFLAWAWERFAPRSTKAPRAEPPRAKGGAKGKRKGGPAADKPAPAAVPAAESRVSAGRVLATGVVVLSLLAFGAASLSFSFSQLEYGVGMTEHKFSFKAAEFLRRYPVPGRMFNFFDVGGFLDWQLYPGALTFLDGRTYNRDIFLQHQTVTAAMPGWDEILRRHGINYAVLKAMDSSGMILPIVSTLANHPDWRLVFSDGLFLVFVKQTPATQEYIRLHEISKGRIPQHIAWEAYHYIFLGVSPALAYRTMANMYELMGDRRASLEAMRRSLEEFDDPYLRDRLMRLERGAGPPGSDASPAGRPGR